MADAHLQEWIKGSAVDPTLAAAALQTLAGSDVLEALAGDRLEQLGGWSQQYRTAAVARLLAPLEPVAAAGGWWCSGLDPLADWAPMAWGCFRPDAPRWDQERNRPRKYEHPIGVAARSFWLPVPVVVAQRVADRSGLSLPLEVAADTDGSGGAFWRWWARTPALPVVITEGAKKSAALLSIGVPAVALPGIWNGSPKDEDGRPQLLADLAAVPLQGRPAWILFDHSTTRTAARDVARAARRLGLLLQRAGAAVMVGTVPGTHGKGADDHLAAGGSWEALAAALEPLAPLPVLPRLRPADVVAPAGRWLADACPIPAPADARLVALAAPMGAGKSQAIRAAIEAAQAHNRRILVIAHRRALGEQNAEELGLPWALEARPGADIREQGLACCVDSLCPDSGLAITPGDWRGAVVVIDEVVAVLRHALFGTATAVAGRRVAVLSTLAAILQNAAQVIVADAQLSGDVLEALEAITGTTAYLIGSEHQPAAGRRLILHPTPASWRAELMALLEDRRRLWVATTAKEGTNGAATIAALVAERWPDARVLVVDADTVADPQHDAHQLAADPNGVAGAYDVVVASPAVAAGLSVDRLAGHFAAVLVFSGGAVDPDAVAQAAARVRDGCPRHVFAPQRSPGGRLQLGCGSGDPAAMVRHLGEHHAALLGQLVAGSADRWSPTENTAGAWLPLWAQLAANQNRQRLAYGATVAGLLEREGYRIEAPQPRAGGEVATARLQALGEVEQTRRDDAVIAAEVITPDRTDELRRKGRRTADERAELERFEVAGTWALGDAPPSPEILEAHRDGLARRLRFGWVLSDPATTAQVIGADRITAQQRTAAGAWAPDLCRELEGGRLLAAVNLGLPGWLERSDWFTAEDQQLLALQALATAHGATMRQALGTSAGKRATTTLRQLLALAGYELEARRSRQGQGARPYVYRVRRAAVPAGVDLARMEDRWREGLGRVAQKSPYIERGEVQAARDPGHPADVAA